MADKPTPVHRAIWFALWIARIKDAELRHVTEGRYPADGAAIVRVPPETLGLDDLVTVARERYEAEERRRDLLGGKVTILLAVGAGIAAMIPAAMVPGPRQWGIATAGACFIISTLLIVHFLAPVTFMSPDVDAELVSGDTEFRKRQLVRDYLQSAHENARVTNYLVDVFRASLRFFVAGILIGIVSGLALPTASEEAGGQRATPRPDEPPTPSAMTTPRSATTPTTPTVEPPAKTR